MFCGLKQKGREEEIFVLCYYRRHYRSYRSVVFHVTESTIRNIYSNLLIYQTLVLCLIAHQKNESVIIEDTSSLEEVVSTAWVFPNIKNVDKLILHSAALG